jgi:hypothetical protein
MIDLGIDDPEVAEMLRRSLGIIDDTVDRLHDEYLALGNHRPGVNWPG